MVCVFQEDTVQKKLRLVADLSTEREHWRIDNKTVMDYKKPECVMRSLVPKQEDYIIEGKFLHEGARYH